jgi:hypothetical protein
MLKNIITAATFLAAALCEVQNVNAVEEVADFGRERPCHEKDGRLTVGCGWTQFKFGPVGSTVHPAYHFHSDVPTILKITDYYCTGDRFEILDNGRSIGRSSESCFDDCKTTTGNPQHAYENDQWSSFTASLTPGRHNITIKVLSSPYKEGFGAIRVDPMLYKCCLSINGLTLIDTPVSYCNAESACEAFGMKLADVDVYNFNDATKVVFGCAGAFGSAYIKSYWGDNYQNSCLALYTGSAAPGGAVSTPVSCNKTMPVLCQGATTSCFNRFLRA